MVWYALEAVDDAVKPAKSLLLPVSARTWVKLAVIVFFLGGAGGSPPTGVQYSTGPDEVGPGIGPTESIPTDVLPSSETLVAIAIAAFAVVVLLAVAFALVGSMMEFALVESLRSREVRVRRYVGDHFWQGLGLFGFRLVLFLATIGPVVVAAFVIFSGVALGSPAAVFSAFLVFLPVLVGFGVVLALADGFTTNFVVPVMILRDGGVVDGWRAFWPALRAEWKQFTVYALLRFALGIALSIAVSLVFGVVALAVLVPFVILAVAAAFAFGGLGALVGSTLGLAVLAVLGLALLVTLGSAMALVNVPAQTYLRYYSLFVLGDARAEFDLIPTMREEVREG